MSNSGTFLLLTAFAYLLGSIPFGKIAGDFHGIDIQKHGSGNIGFANVRRTLGWGPGLIVLVGDISKGFIPVALSNQYLVTYQVLIVAIAAVAGHIFPVWLNFKGGKGIATGLGITLALEPLLAAIWSIVYLIALAIFKKSGPSSICATWSLALLCPVIAPKYSWLYFTLALLATWTHRANLRAVFKKTANAN